MTPAETAARHRKKGATLQRHRRPSGRLAKHQADIPGTRPSHRTMTIIGRRRPLRAAAVGLAGAAMIAGSALATASPASASGWATISSNSGGAWLRTQPSTGSSGIEYLGNGTQVLMLCWIDAQWATGN